MNQNAPKWAMMYLLRSLCTRSIVYYGTTRRILALPAFQVELNLAFADLRYRADPDASGEDIVAVTCSDGYLEGTASSSVQLAWPTGVNTRRPTLTFRSPMAEMTEDTSILLSPVAVRFGDGRALVIGRVNCSAGGLQLGDEVFQGGGNVLVQEGGYGGDVIVLQGIPEDIAIALSMVLFTPPKDWSSTANGAIILTMDIEAERTREIHV